VRFGYAVRDLTIGQLLAAKALRNGDRTFLACLSDGRRYSYADVERASNAIARGLAAHGVRHGDHVALMLENCPEQILAYFALGKIGAVAVPLHAASRGRMLQYYLEHSDSVALVTSTDLLDRLPEHRPAALRRVFVVGAREAKAPRPLDDLPIVPFEDLECRSSDAFESPAKFSDLAFIKYTSGTTGPAKGVMMTQARTLLYGITTVESNLHRALEPGWLHLDAQTHASAAGVAQVSGILSDRLGQAGHTHQTLCLAPRRGNPQEARFSASLA
jgi:carnitine-CoA ligase